MNHAVRPRKPLMAALMSLVLPGFGQLYNGQFNKAIWVFLGFGFLTVNVVPFVALRLPAKMTMPALALGLLLTLAIWIYSMLDSWRVARSMPDYVPRIWQASGVYVAVFILLNLIVLPLLMSGVRARQVESFRVPAASMIPTVLPGDLVFADKRYNCHGCGRAVKRGDIVVFTFPNDRTVYFVKRVIGLPGERVQVEQGEVRVDGRPLTARRSGTEAIEHDGSRRWHVSWAAEDPRLADTDLTVPAGEIFLMGDNRNLSEDSRVFGPVPLRDVVGKLRQVWFSSDERGVRWGRLGKTLE